MLCSNCQKREATVFCKQLINNKVSEQHLCLDCAKAVNVPVPSGSPVFDLLLSVLGKPSAAPARRAALQCQRCGLDFEEFRRTGLLGCPHCYESFAERLEELLRRIHGGTARHAGKTPGETRVESGRRRAQEASRLRRQLEEAVRAERYEEAARLRDLLRKLEP